VITEHRTYGPAVPEAGLERPTYVSPLDTIETYFDWRDWFRGGREFRTTMSRANEHWHSRMIPEALTVPD